MNTILTPQQALELIQTKLKPKRVLHSIAVSREAVHLATRYGGDPLQAELAGLLHDIMKDVPGKEQLQWAQKSDIIMDNAEMDNGQLWHAPAGEAYLRICCDVADTDLLMAVRFHTTGRAGMSNLEQIIYLADIISEDRNFTGVERIRNAAQNSLKEGVLAGLFATLDKIKKDGGTLHPRSEEAISDLNGGVK